MSFYSELSATNLAIRQMVFHLVGPLPQNFIRLLAVDPGRHSGFFLERIRSVNAGLPYEFLANSSTRDSLQRVQDAPENFQLESEQLAENFQNMHGGQTAAGAFLLFHLHDGSEDSFALLKYDDEEVLSYEVTNAPGGGKQVSLDNLERTFVKSRDALQKSALIRLNGQSGEIRVIDRQNQQKVARYYENFLSAKRIREDADITEKLAKVAREAIRNNKEHVPPEVFKNATRRVFEAASGGGIIEAEEQKRYIEAAVGQALPDDNPVVRDFKKGLKRERIENMPVALDPEHVPRPRAGRIKTANGISISFPTAQRGLIEVDGDRIVIADRSVEETDATELDR